jgi:hypothetical protein
MLKNISQQIQIKLSSQTWLFCLYAIITASSTYAFMYGFRKPIAVGFYADSAMTGLSLKTLYLTMQIIGYALSKFIGIKVISELQSHGRAKAIFILVLIAWLSLLGFAIAPTPWNAFFMLLNGLPLGMVWGIVFSYLEGRKVTEILAAGLCTSFIIASGLVKSVGSFLLIEYTVNEFWMPFATATCFFPFLILSVWMLDQLPPPNSSDIKQRSARVPMTKADRKALLRLMGFGLMLLTIGYVLLTILRDLRDNFAADVWLATGLDGAPELFTLTELPIALVVLCVIALLKLVKDNKNAMIVNHLIICAGFTVTFLSSVAYQKELITPINWMIINGIGLYLAYIPFTTTLFERLIATFNRPANVGFLTYLCDSFGYLGTVGVMVYQGLATTQPNWNIFLTQLSIIAGILGVFFTFISLGFFIVQNSKNKQEHTFDSASCIQNK